MRRFAILAAQATLGACLGLAALDATAAAAEPIASMPGSGPRIYGGEFVEPCGWPTVVSLGGLCTGTLVHPQVVIYAAHCGTSFSSVQLGESIAPAHAEHSTSSVARHGRMVSSPGAGHDWAFCTLSEPLLDIPIVPPLMGCETDVLRPEQPVTLVGFGESETGYGDKKAVLTTLGSVDDNEAFVGGDGQDSCVGDSGGPAFVRLGDGESWRVFGITSYGSQNCLDGGFYSMMHTGMEWFESRSGFGPHAMS